MCRSTADGYRRCRSHASTHARELVADRLRYYRKRLVDALNSNDQTEITLNSHRLAAEAANSHTAAGADLPEALAGINLQRLSDDELHTLTTDPRIIEDQDACDTVFGELDRRDAEDRIGDRIANIENSYTALTPTRPGNDDPVTALQWARHSAAQWGETCESLDRVLTGGMKGKDREAVLTKVFGYKHLHRTQKAERIKAAKEDWHSLMHIQRLAAEDECRGYLLKKSAAAAGKNPDDLFAKNATWVRANASREFLDWRQNNPRITQSEYITSVLEDDTNASTRRAAKTSRASARATANY